jgi:hypothetical protein
MPKGVRERTRDKRKKERYKDEQLVSKSKFVDLHPGEPNMLI